MPSYVRGTKRMAYAQYGGTIRITDDTRDRLRVFRESRDTMDDTVGRVLDIAERYCNVKREAAE